MSYIERISYNFKRLRKLKGWTQVICAAYGEVDKSYVGKIEARLMKSFGQEAVEKWAKIFDC
ncbi:hypothetical protein MBAV_001804, partial [Candidatus Magnetobacterium bavaricum]